MAIEITMPQLGESVTEGTITKWLVKQGDFVKQYDPIAEVLTDKVTAEIPSSYTGVIHEIIAKENETVEVGKVICTIEIEGNAEKKAFVKNIEVVKGQKQRYSPAVLKLAEEHHINLQEISGTGFGGRITRKDVLAYIHNKEKYQLESVPTLVNEPINDCEVPVSHVRRAIANNMLRSKREIPHAWMMVEVDVTNLVNFRNRVKDEFKQREGFPLTYLPFFMKAVVDGLKKYPMLNSTWENDRIIQKQAINLSIAVATDDALYVPVIKNADELTIKGLAKNIHELATKVREGKLTNEDLQGGTFTVNNTGSFGSILSMPIINYPQAAILSVESIVKRPVVMNDDMLAIRSMVNLCLSLDHRILDGLVCGRFLAFVKERLENMTEDFILLY